MARTSRNEWLEGATARLHTAGIGSAHLDAELLLIHTLGITRTALHAHPDQIIDTDLLAPLDARLNLRELRVPVAYLIGHKEFFGHLFRVTPTVLIPRPETERLVEIVLDSGLQRILDVGTGSGAIALSVALEQPGWDVWASDVSAAALEVAESNQRALGASVTFLRSNLLKSIPATVLSGPLIIAANLPYVDREWERSAETAFEPELALYAEEEGLALIEQLFAQANDRLAPGSLLVIESDERQQDPLIKMAATYALAHQMTDGLVSVFTKR